MPIRLLDVLAREADALTHLLAEHEPSVTVPSCPGWSLADLGRHTGGVHAWAREALETAPETAPGPEPEGPADDHAVADWYRAQADDLLTALSTTDPLHPCWTFDRQNRTAGFWLRRQAHEATLHRWDAARALGLPARIDPELAFDGIDEVLHVFLPRQVRLGRVPANDDTVHLVVDGTGDLRHVSTGDQAGKLVGTVRGSADALLLLLWRRIDRHSARLVTSGDLLALDACLDRPLTP